MTTRFPIVEESGVPPLTLIELPDQEALITARMLRFKELWALRDPPFGAQYDVENTEFDPIKINQECIVSFEMNVMTRINQFGRATTLAYAWGDNLDAIASRYPGGVPRLAEETYDPATASPPEITAKDNRYRRRIYLSANALAASGTEESYVFWALTADGNLRDASAVVHRARPEAYPIVTVTCLSDGPDPAPSTARLLAIRVFLHRPEVKPLTDVIAVAAPDIVRTTYDVGLYLTQPADADFVRAQVEGNLAATVMGHYFLGSDHTRFMIAGACAIAGVQNVNIISPAQDIEVDARTAVLVESVRVFIYPVRRE